MNIIRCPRNDCIRIQISFSKRKAFWTFSEAQKVMLNLPSPLMTKANNKCKQLPIHMTHPMWLWYMRMNFNFGAQNSFCSPEYPKKNTHPLIFSEDWLIKSSEKWKCGDKFSCAYLSRIGAHSSKVTLLSKIRIIFRKKSHRYSVWENHPNMNTNNIWSEKIAEIRIRFV